MYDELIKVLRTCSDPNIYCEDCAYYEKCFHSEERFSITDPAADAIEELLASCKNFESALKDSVEECEKLQTYVDLYKDITEKSQKAATEYKQRLQKSEDDNVNLTGLLAEEHAKYKWIPVTERLPEQGKRYLVIRFDEVTKTQFIDILWHDAHDLWWNRLYKGKYNVTHWMPLPQPPKEET